WQQQTAMELIYALTAYLKSVNVDELPLETNQETSLHLDCCIFHDRELFEGLDNAGLESFPETESLFANVYYSQGRYGEAEQLYSRALAGREKKLGSEHPDILDTMQNLAIVYRRQGRYDEAEQLCSQAMEGTEKKLGSEHPDTLQTVQNLANVYRRQGRYDEAEQLYSRALVGREKKLGSEHPDTLAIMQNLANVYYSQ